MKVYGSYSFTSPEGTRFIVKYTADENGFRPTLFNQPAYEENKIVDRFGEDIDKNEVGLTDAAIKTLLGR